MSGRDKPVKYAPGQVRVSLALQKLLTGLSEQVNCAAYQANLATRNEAVDQVDNRGADLNCLLAGDFGSSLLAELFGDS